MSEVAYLSASSYPHSSCAILVLSLRAAPKSPSDRVLMVAMMKMARCWVYCAFRLPYTKPVASADFRVGPAFDRPYAHSTRVIPFFPDSRKSDLIAMHDSCISPPRTLRPFRDHTPCLPLSPQGTEQATSWRPRPGGGRRQWTPLCASTICDWRAPRRSMHLTGREEDIQQGNLQSSEGRRLLAPIGRASTR